jgi:hypothetical protein
MAAAAEVGAGFNCDVRPAQHAGDDMMMVDEDQLLWARERAEKDATGDSKTKSSFSSLCVFV